MTFGSWSNGIYITSINKTTMKPTGNSYRIATKSGGSKAPAWFTIQTPDIIIYSYPLANAAQA